VLLAPPISVATGGKGKGRQLPPTGSGLDPEIRANPMRRVKRGGMGRAVNDEYGKKD